MPTERVGSRRRRYPPVYVTSSFIRASRRTFRAVPSYFPNVAGDLYSYRILHKWSCPLMIIIFFYCNNMPSFSRGRPKSYRRDPNFRLVASTSTSSHNNARAPLAAAAQGLHHDERELLHHGRHDPARVVPHHD